VTVELLHGDARVLAKDIHRKITHVVTDPPFGVDHVSNFARTKRGKELQREIAGDKDAEEACELFYTVMDELIPHFADEVEFYIFTSWKVVDVWMEMVNFIQPGVVRLENMLIFEKGWPGLGDLRGNWPFSFELILYAKKGDRPIKSRRSSILAVDRLIGTKMIHPTEKPVQLIEILLNQSLQPGDFVVDPFAGSGSTLEACKKVGVDGIGFELDRGFYEAAQERLSTQMLDFG
jgi:adenine-specific DNA-methyltransferase